MINKVILVGRLGKDPEVRSTPSGTTVTKFSLATDERFTDRSGEKQERTEWHNCEAWGKLADICVVELATPHTTPRYTHETAIYSYLAYASQAADVRHTIANGRLLMRDREVLSLNESAVLREANDWLSGSRANQDSD